tara:strand:- start:710 stop:2134 length:1425 start_codon:yes stop_codon:yes gene_type:complete
MPITVLGGTTSAAAAYEIANSVRFNDGDSPSLRRTIPDDASSTGNRNLWTFSTWLKRGVLGTQQAIFGSYQNSNYHTVIEFNTSNQLNFFDEYNGSKNGQRTTNRVFRDCSAWYHIVCVWDKNNGTTAQKMRVYVNGTEESSFATSTAPSNAGTLGADDQDISIGERETVGQNFDGYFAETFFVDGTAYAASAFGEFDEDSPTIWKPKDCSGDLTFGTNGFWLDYETSGTLGNDANGGTDYTATNLAAADQATDTPTNNFCTMNPLQNRSSLTFSEGNNKIAGVADGYGRGGFGTMAVNTGKWYFEIKVASSIPGNTTMGICNTGGIQSQSALRWNPFSTGTEYSYGYRQNGEKMTVNTSSSYGDTYTEDDIISCAFDLDNNKIYFAKNGTWQDSGDPTSGGTGTGSAFDLQSGEDYMVGHHFDNGPTIEFNFGGCPAFSISSGNADDNGYGNFEYDVPAGYYALCTKNLAEFG